MRTPICRSAGMGRAVCFVASVMAFNLTSVSAQVNSWINPMSGNWDQASSWSLDALPGSSQSVMITNSLWKAVAINPSTPINFPDSMTVSSLTIRGASDTENTLLLNYFGTAVPLTVLNGVTLQDGAQILNFNSGLVVQGGTITVTNSQINQDGGFVRTTDAPLNLNNSRYDLTNGVFEAGSVWVGAPVLSYFNQYGGSAVIENLTLGVGGPGGAHGGAYALYGGTLDLPGGLKLFGDDGSAASYLQEGGTNRTSQVMIEPGLFGISPDFKLNGGLLVDNDVSIDADDFGSVTLNQNGGTHVVTNLLTIAGAAGSLTEVHPGTYSLNGGTLSAGAIVLASRSGDARFIQTNGTTQAGQIQADGYWIWKSDLTLSGGTLNCSNLSLTNGANIHQYSGALVISNSIDFGGYREPGTKIYSRYEFFGGTLAASNISVGGDWIIGDSNGTNRISNPGSCTLSHMLQIGNAVEQLGRFILAGDATIDLAGSASRLSFANSSSETWAGDAMLVLVNWNGNPSGGGAEKLKFGTDQSGLSPGELSQIRFRLDSSTNLYPAKILNTGEVVPDAIAPFVGFSKQGSNLVLNWPPGWSLQTATNVTGPYIDVPGATSPHTNDMTLDPHRFFRLSEQPPSQ